MATLPTDRPPDAEQRLRQLEDRIARLEAYVGLAESDALRAEALEVLRPLHKSADDLELEVGQNWFGPFGITTLALGGGFMLTLPYPDLPPALPSLVGLIVAAVLFLAAHLSRGSFVLVSGFLRGAAMALLYCATLRLFFFGAQPTFARDGAAAPILLTLAPALNVALAWQQRSVTLMVLALLTACVTPLALGSPAAVLVGCVAVTLVGVLLANRPRWGALLPIAAAMVFATYVLWAMGDPVLGRAYRWAATPAGAPLVLLLCVVGIGVAPVLNRGQPGDAVAAVAGAVLNTVGGYGVFLVHTYATQAGSFILWHVTAATVFLWLAAVLWLRHRSQISTFLYAMCGYAALTVAIASFAHVPEVFVWLSVESLVVVGTAVWFRSRFIVVANFIIYGFVVLGYMLLNQRESGVSVAFGLVALLSARVLNWQRHRLALQTEMMRNAYLVSALVIFPYALHHLVAPRFTALAWVALAAGYYGLNLLMRNQKYRLMGHATLLLTVVYLAIPSHPGLTPAYRIASFLALGAALLVVSMTATRARHRRAARSVTVQRATDAASVRSDTRRDS